MDNHEIKNKKAAFKAVKNDEPEPKVYEPKKTCLNCGKEFVPKRKSHSFCSAECCKDWRSE